VSGLCIDVELLGKAELQYIKRAALRRNMQQSLGRAKETPSNVFEFRSYPASSSR
jgi:hypothetical protein